jgi:hypothetical protein
MLVPKAVTVRAPTYLPTPSRTTPISHTLPCSHAFRPEIENLLANGSTQKFIAQRYHTTEANHTFGSKSMA